MILFRFFSKNIILSSLLVFLVVVSCDPPERTYSFSGSDLSKCYYSIEDGELNRIPETYENLNIDTFSGKSLYFLFQIPLEKFGTSGFKVLCCSDFIGNRSDAFSVDVIQGLLEQSGELSVLNSVVDEESGMAVLEFRCSCNVVEDRQKEEMESFKFSIFTDWDKNKKMRYLHNFYLYTIGK